MTKPKNISEVLDTVIDISEDGGIGVADKDRLRTSIIELLDGVVSEEKTFESDFSECNHWRKCFNRFRSEILKRIEEIKK